MARPKRQTVDYFPHQCKHGRTMFIVDQKYGNDGYSFWFKVLELLGSTEGHFIDCRNPDTWEFLQAITHLDDNICTDILNLLAKLEAIDGELWSKKIIWSDNFITGIADVYRNRRVKTPPKPDFYTQKPHETGVSTPENPQSKVKESKGKEKKVKKEYIARFEEFWEVYPLREGKKIGKAETCVLFEKLTEEEQSLIISAAENYAASTKYPVDPIRFFKSREYPTGLWRNWIPEDNDSPYSDQGNPNNLTVQEKIKIARREYEAEQGRDDS